MSGVANEGYGSAAPVEPVTLTLSPAEFEYLSDMVAIGCAIAGGSFATMPVEATTPDEAEFLEFLIDRTAHNTAGEAVLERLSTLNNLD